MKDETTRLPVGSIEHRLITIRKAVRHLGSIDGLSPTRADIEACELVIERNIALLDDLAFAINCQVARVILGENPVTFAASCLAAARVGMINVELALALAPDGYPQSLAFQFALNETSDEVARVLSAAINRFTQYAEQVQAWSTAQPTAL